MRRVSHTIAAAVSHGIHEQLFERQIQLKRGLVVERIGGAKFFHPRGERLQFFKTAV